jgi:hypothetical protein
MIKFLRRDGIPERGLWFSKVLKIFKTPPKFASRTNKFYEINHPNLKITQSYP